MALNEIQGPSGAVVCVCRPIDGLDQSIDKSGMQPLKLSDKALKDDVGGRGACAGVFRKHLKFSVGRVATPTRGHPAASVNAASGAMTPAWA